jgi:quercetin dioxygenase-like cupin family protein
MPKLETAHVDSCTVHHLPGRDWFYLLGPVNCQTKNLAFGLAEFPGNSMAASHTHAEEEEIIYILTGEGAILTPEEEILLKPGLAVFIPPRLEHRIRVDGDQPMKLVTLFSWNTAYGWTATSR